MEWRTGARLPNRVAQSIDSRHQQVRPSVEQVHCEEERSSWNPVAAIVRHERSMPGLSERRNALPLFRPTLALRSAPVSRGWPAQGRPRTNREITISASSPASLSSFMAGLVPAIHGVPSMFNSLEV